MLIKKPRATLRMLLDIFDGNRKMSTEVSEAPKRNSTDTEFLVCGWPGVIQEVGEIAAIITVRIVCLSLRAQPSRCLARA